MKICLYGASSTELDSKYYDAAFELGKIIAKRGHKLVFGGGTQGLMGSCVRGVQSEGGRATGVAPRFFNIPGILHESCEEFIYTDTMRERKQIMECMSDAFAVVPGGVGTFEEFFETFTLKQLGQINKPIAILNVDGYYDLLLEMLQKMIKEGFMRDKCAHIYGVFEDPEKLIDYIETVKEQPLSVKHLKNI